MHDNNIFRSRLSRNVIPKIHVPALFMINFLFSVFYFGPSFLEIALKLTQTIPIVILDEVNNFILFDIKDIRETFTPIDVKSILNNEQMYNEALPTAYNPPNQFAYVHSGLPSCHGNVIMLILIKSAVENFALRQAIRTSWGQKDDHKFYIRFLLGSKKHLQRLVDLETAKFGDIIQKDFADEYRNNTYKTMMGFDWSVRYCDKAEFTLFVDDDHYTNKLAILDYASALSVDTRRTLFVGYLLFYRRPLRYPDNKWFVSRSEYPYPRYPPYLAGGGYVVSKTVVRKFSLAFPFIRYYWIDDTWLGIVALTIGVEPMGDDRFYSEDYDRTIKGRFLSHRESKNPAEIIEIFERNENVKYSIFHSYV